jgi:hypothetical protein
VALEKAQVGLVSRGLEHRTLLAVAAFLHNGLHNIGLVAAPTVRGAPDLQRITWRNERRL